jgi:DNA-binding NtrC family response regulator
MASVLVVDDDEQIRKLLRTLLEPEGIEVIEAEHGKDAIAQYRENRIDLVLLDIIMPEMEGIETIIKLRKINPEIDFIGISGGGKLAGEYYLKMMKAFRPRYLFKKPIDTDELLQAVKSVLSQSK